MTRLWYRALMWLLRRGQYGWARCANRYEITHHCGPLVVVTTIQDTREEDGYSREELYRMLRLIRQHEELQEWKVPEPVCNIKGCRRIDGHAGDCNYPSRRGSAP